MQAWPFEPCGTPLMATCVQGLLGVGPGLAELHGSWLSPPVVLPALSLTGMIPQETSASASATGGPVGCPPWQQQEGREEVGAGKKLHLSAITS